MSNNRDYKQFFAGSYYHIYNRGNGRMNIYKDDQDYSNFLKRLKLTLALDDNVPRASLQTIRIQPLPKNSFSIVCYCLMPNHFHFLIKQNNNIPISMLMNKVCSSYSKYFNKKYDHVGHLFQDQFKAIIIDSDEYLLWLSAYIHQNPKVACLINDPKDYKWSSYSDFLNSNNNICDDKDIVLCRFKNVVDYKDYVSNSYEAIREGKMIDKLHMLFD